MLLSPITSAFDSATQPVFPFTYFNLPISTLDFLGAIRLCLILRQIREKNYAQHASETHKVEEKSYAKDLTTTLLVAYGGEAVIAPLLGVPPSFMVSGAVPLLYAGIQGLIELLPHVPPPSLQTELPLSILDGFTRAFLLCSTVPPTVTASGSAAISNSPWCLLLSSLVIANGGFFLTNLFSFLHPTPLTLTTPAELLPYGWTTADLWCAPLITAMYALLAHTQPFWSELHAALWTAFGTGADGCAAQGGKGCAGNMGAARRMDEGSARALCAVLLGGLFVGRTVKNFGRDFGWGQKVSVVTVKEKTQ